MIEIYSIGASIFLLAVLLAVLPFRLTWIGKTAIFICAVMIGSVLYLGYSMFQFSLIFPIVILLTALMSYIVLNRVPLFHETSESGQNASHLKPLFSFHELKEKAEQAETMDHYYIESTKLVKEDEVPEESSLMGQDAIDKLLQQYEEPIASEETKEAATIEEPYSALECEEFDFDLPLERDEVNQTESIDQEESYLDVIKEEVIDRSSLLNDVEEDKIEVTASREIESQDDQLFYDYEETNDSSEADEEYDLIEIRKKIFSELEEISVIEEVELKEDRTQEESVETKEQEENRFSSEELEAGFDDLEELYLQRKKNLKNEEEGK